MATYYPLMNPFMQATDNSGNIISGAVIYVYFHNTSNKATIYSDYSGTVQSNPIICGSDARYKLYLNSNYAYDIIMKNSLGVEVSRNDNVIMPPSDYVRVQEISDSGSATEDGVLYLIPLGA